MVVSKILFARNIFYLLLFFQFSCASKITRNLRKQEYESASIVKKKSQFLKLTNEPNISKVILDMTPPLNSELLLNRPSVESLEVMDQRLAKITFGMYPKTSYVQYKVCLQSEVPTCTQGKLTTSPYILSNLIEGSYSIILQACYNSEETAPIVCGIPYEFVWQQDSMTNEIANNTLKRLELKKQYLFNLAEDVKNILKSYRENLQICKKNNWNDSSVEKDQLELEKNFEMQIENLSYLSSDEVAKSLQQMPVDIEVQKQLSDIATGLLNLQPSFSQGDYNDSLSGLLLVANETSETSVTKDLVSYCRNKFDSTLWLDSKKIIPILFANAYKDQSINFLNNDRSTLIFLGSMILISKELSLEEKSQCALPLFLLSVFQKSDAGLNLSDTKRVSWCSAYDLAYESFSYIRNELSGLVQELDALQNSLNL